MTEKDITALMPAESEHEGWKAFVRLMRHHSYGYSALSFQSRSLRPSHCDT